MVANALHERSVKPPILGANGLGLCRLVMDRAVSPHTMLGVVNVKQLLAVLQNVVSHSKGPPTNEEIRELRTPQRTL